jgi:hypothetical protein
LWREVASDPRSALETGLSPTDLQSLLLTITRARSSTVTTARVTQRWREDAFVRPSNQDPRVMSRLEAALWARLPLDIDGLDLSPVAPFGAYAAVAGVDQNRVLTTTRTSEVVSDPTVQLALEAAERRRADRSSAVHLAAIHRVLRAQRFPEGYAQHFRLMALVSSARNTGSGRTEAVLLIRHLGFYADALSSLFPSHLVRIRLTTFDDTAVAERVEDTVVPGLQPLPGNVEIADDPGRSRGRGYYRDVAARIDLVLEGVEVEVGDGGFTDWTSRLLSDAKERCLTSCVSTERLAALLADQA